MARAKEKPAARGRTSRRPRQTLHLIGTEEEVAVRGGRGYTQNDEGSKSPSSFRQIDPVIASGKGILRAALADGKPRIGEQPRRINVQ